MCSWGQPELLKKNVTKKNSKRGEACWEKEFRQKRKRDEKEWWGRWKWWKFTIYVYIWTHERILWWRWKTRRLLRRAEEASSPTTSKDRLEDPIWFLMSLAPWAPVVKKGQPPAISTKWNQNQAGAIFCPLSPMVLTTQIPGSLGLKVTSL